MHVFISEWRSIHVCIGSWSVPALTVGVSTYTIHVGARFLWLFSMPDIHGVRSLLAVRCIACWQCVVCLERGLRSLVSRVGQNHTCKGVYGVHTVFLAGKSPYIRSYTMCIYGSGQPYL
jgi:hypothetical protein